MVESGIKLSGKKKAVVLTVAITLIVAIIVVTVLFMPITLAVPWQDIEDMHSNVQVLKPHEGGNDTDYTSLVKLNEDGSVDTTPWKIIQFTDVHLSESISMNKITLEKFIQGIQREKPDLVIVTGDLITSSQNHLRAVQFCNIMEKFGLYWAYCLGNHEGDAGVRGVSRKGLIELFAGYEHCLVEDDVKLTSDGKTVWGNGNYVINLLGDGYSVKQSLIFMDSGDEILPDDYNRLSKEIKNLPSDSYDFLKATQIQWYNEQVAKITDNLTNGVQTMVYIHIPLVQQANVKYISEGAVLGEDWYVSADPHMAVKKGWNLVPGTGSYEGACCAKYDSGMYAAMVANKASTQALFCGHDHVNTSILYEDYTEGEKPVLLCYGQGSAYASYTLYSRGQCESEDDNLQGYVVVTINDDCTFDMIAVRNEAVNERLPRVINSLPYKG